VEIRYDDLAAAIRLAPATWLPALMIEIIEAGIAKDVWRPGKIGQFAAKMEERKRRERAGEDPHDAGVDDRSTLPGR